MKVRVYWNIVSKVWSIVDARTGLVIGRQGELRLVDATFHVSEAGRQRVLREKRKNVHAKVAGRLTVALPPPGHSASRIRYNPYQLAHFVDGSGNRVDTCPYVHFLPDGTVIGYFGP